VLEAAGSASPRAGVVRQRLGPAMALEARARVTCAGGDTKRAKKELKGAFKKLGRVRALLAAKSSKTIPGRDRLKGDLGGIRADLKSLKGAFACPAAAAIVGR
jgi:hypothetical protein